MTLPLLVVTAVAAEAEAVRAGADPGHVVVEPVGVGPAAAAAGTARLLATGRYRAVISAGIAGGFVGRAAVGSVVIGVRSIAADLGAETPDGFLTVDELGFGSGVIPGDPALVKSLTEALPTAVPGDVVTLSTVTGTAATAERLARSYPQAVAEAMEGYGVAVAAHGLPFAELRSISNPIGPRDRAQWRLKEAFAALSTASAALWIACG
ncbi:Futalosine hydrolase [Paractinoplanes abujensis]|uniref:Futalosine hydrolase n=1 Tax=Paractinoplanes abujensis TaxID=882441 RepID=A0A7W7CWG9_9ACTN|nr:futalosine hydrolase [Actinoplanes abujensis]MBB4695734.1 futalosine hydrolase [Actinoplanes abujensis]GID23319.1 Futalosine hydrolase [Actinoplanes abujensis]